MWEGVVHVGGCGSALVGVATHGRVWHMWEGVVALTQL